MLLDLVWVVIYKMWPVKFGYLLRNFGPSAVQASLVGMSYLLAFTVFAGMDILGKAPQNCA